MIIYNYEVDPKSLPFDLDDCREELGLLESAVIKCPGIYHLHMSATEKHHTGLDLYVVLKDAPITFEARTYGKKAPSHPDLLFFQDEAEDFTHKIIEYEILKFYITHNIPTKSYENLHSKAIFGMEVCPDYFGTLPAPPVTPWGYTTRYKAIIPGIFWIETDQCKVTLAMSQVFRDDISEEVLSLAELTPFDREHGIKETKGYYFFQEKIMCLAVFELMLFNCSSNWELIDERALMNAIWKNCPEYAIAYNRREQEGLNDNIGLVIQMTIDPDYELSGSDENMITITPEVGTAFFAFEKEKP